MMQFITGQLSERLITQAEELADELMDSSQSALMELVDSSSPLRARPSG
jgi:broad specificity phosphatase PhoE